MLVLQRERDEELVIVVPPSDKETIITQTIVDFRPGYKVRIGTTAPKETLIHRKEVYDAIKMQQAAASRLAAGKEDPAPVTPAKSVFDAANRRG